MYAIVRVGGKQYRVEKGDSLVVDRMRADEGAKVELEPLLYRSDKAVFDGPDLGKVKVEAVVTGHERGKKLHVLKFKPKKGYKRRTGHRADLTRLEIKDIKLLSRKPAAQAKEARAEPAKPEPAKPEPAKPAAKARAKPASGRAKPAPKGRSATVSEKPAARKETDDGS